MTARLFSASLPLDLRYALRTLRRAPAFALSATLILALGIGANSAVFSVLDALLFRPLPVRRPNQLVELLSHYPGEPRGSYFDFNAYQHFRDENYVLSTLTGISPSQFEVSAAHLDPETVYGEYVLGNLFPTLGLQPALGRLISPEDDQPGSLSAAVAVLSWSYWQSRFHSDPSIAGKPILIDQVPVTIIGVAPRAFFGLQTGVAPSLWVPTALEPLLQHPSRRLSGQLPLQLLGRLKPGVSRAQAQAELAVLDRFRIAELAQRSLDPQIRHIRFEVAPAATGFSMLRDHFAQPLLLLMLIVALLLLLACANLASLLLARAVSRRGELALRVALGAGRLRLFRQALTESVVLAALGGLMSIFLASFAANTLLRILTSGRRMPGLPPHLDLHIHLDARILLFTAAVTLSTGLVFGLVPAWNAFASTPWLALRESGTATRSGRHRLAGNAFVIAQVSFSLTLLAAAGLLSAHLWRLQHVDLGFRRDHVLSLTLGTAHSGYSPDQLLQLDKQLLARLETIPGVRSATFSAATPLSGAGASRFVNVAGHAERPEDRRYVAINWIAPRYFETLGTPLLSGHDFTPDDATHPPIAIVNQAFASHYFDNRSPIGHSFTFNGENGTFNIIGVVGNARYYEIREKPLPTVYLNAFQSRLAYSSFALRTSLEPTNVTGAFRRTVRALIKSVPITAVTTLDDQVNATIVPERLIAVISMILGALGLLLAAAGLFGLLAFGVARRTGEIGVRIALGATRRAVIAMVLREALALVFAGLAVGTPLALWTARLAASQIEGLNPNGVAALLVAAPTLLTAALAAAYVPAARASRVDPALALRHE